MSVLNGQDQGTIILAQQDYIPLTVESFLVDRKAFGESGSVQNDDAYSRLIQYEWLTVLAIDEIDKLRVTDWFVEQHTDLINKRYRGGLVGEVGILLATNCDPASLPEWIGSRLRDGATGLCTTPTATFIFFHEGELTVQVSGFCE